MADDVLRRWYEATQQVAATKPLIKTERLLRQEVFAAYFETPKEGANKVPLADGWTLQAHYGLRRDVIEATLALTWQALRDLQLTPEHYFSFVPRLNLAPYRALEHNNHAAFLIIEAGIVTKPQAPTIIMVPPK